MDALPHLARTVRGYRIVLIDNLRELVLIKNICIVTVSMVGSPADEGVGCFDFHVCYRNFGNAEYHNMRDIELVPKQDFESSNVCQVAPDGTVFARSKKNAFRRLVSLYMAQKVS